MPTISLPNNWAPRHYQADCWRYLHNGGKRAVIIAHRRWGKDDLALHWAACAAHERIGTYWHMLPEATQARKAIWDAVNPHTGKRRIDEAFPPAIRATTREQEMMIRFRCGSTWQVLGSDNFDSFVGSPPAGVVFSEWALADPRAWAYTRPIIRENNGWGVFITTPRGHNHAEASLKLAQSNPDYFAQVSTAQDTGVFSADALAHERAEYISEYGDTYGEALYEQEYNCSFNAAVLGSYYGYLIERLEHDGRITDVQPEPGVPVDTFWDLGVDDHMAIWVVQFVGAEIRVLEFISGGGTGLEDYINIIKEKPYEWRCENGLIVAHGPHDLRLRELTRGNTSRIEVARSMGMQFRIVPSLSVVDGRQAVRSVLPRCWFDQAHCEQGISALQNHRAEWDTERKILGTKPINDWCCHGADAFRYMAVTWKNQVAKVETPYKSKEFLISAQKTGMMTSNQSILEYVRRKERSRSED